MKKPSPILSPQRNARLVAWARLMLAWVGALMFSTTLGKISERHLLARMYYTNLDRVAATIANIVLLHAFAKLGYPSSGGTPFTLRDHTGVGFARRTQVRNILRAGQGVWLRRRLNHRNLLTRLGLIVQALNDIDALAARAARRLRHGLTRLFAIRAVRPPHDAARTLATPEILAADSS
ncbi:hypothetical protein [Vitreimonas sp.]|uniref:hypothetical protein n=1 Tax=Vitreimonas sp. TaxID=3069702 RepID=UPI002EDBB5B6